MGKVALFEQVVIEAVVAQGMYGDMAIDDVSLSQECQRSPGRFFSEIYCCWRQRLYRRIRACYASLF